MPKTCLACRWRSQLNDDELCSGCASQIDELAHLLRQHEAFSPSLVAAAIVARYVLLPRGDGSSADVLARR